MALTVDPKRLLSCSDSEFDHALGSMKMQDLVATVSCLQSEMESEQTRFNDLTAQLSTCPDPSSSQYSVLSEKLVTSQSCLATLMDRNMRCFTKTAAHPENNVSVVKVGSSPVTPPVVSNGTVRKTSSKEGSFTLRSSTADVTRIVVSTDNHDTRVNGATVAKDTVNHKPVVAKEIPKPVVAKEIPKPVVAKEIPKPVVAKEIPKPVVAKDISKPAVQKHTAVVNNKDTIPVAKDNNSVTMDTKLDSASEEKINFSAARSLFESNPAKTQKKVSSSQQMYTVSKPSQQTAPPVQGAPKGRPAAWQQQLKRLASNDFAVPMAVQNTSHMRPHGVQKAASVDQSLKSSLKVNSGQIANRQMSLQEVHHNGSNGHSDVQKDLSSHHTNGDHAVVLPRTPYPLTAAAVTKHPLAPVTKQPVAPVTKQPSVLAKEAPVKAVPTPVVTKETAPMAQVHAEIVSQVSKAAVTSQNSVSACDGEVVRASRRVAALYMSEKSQDYADQADELVQERVTLRQWDPTKLLNELYQVKLSASSDVSANYVSMEGYMEKLPLNKRKATLLKTWKRRYFKANAGSLCYFESKSHVESTPISDDSSDNGDTEQASGTIQLMGGTVEELGSCMIGIDDGRGRYMVVRCPSEAETQRWLSSLSSHCVDNQSSRWVRPVLSPPRHQSKRVAVIDLGSSSIRAGVLGEQAGLPSVFFPTIVATQAGKVVIGSDALKPATRQSATLSFPIKPSQLVDKFTINMDVMPELLMKVFNSLKVDPSEYYVMLSAPTNLSDKLKAEFMDILIKKFKVLGANIQNQALLALYSYNTTSGIVVDIGERLEILPVTEGYIVEAGASQQIYGGQSVAQSLNTSFTERQYRFFTEVESLLVRLAVEKMCYLSEDYKNELESAMTKTQQEKVLSLKEYDLPPNTYTELGNDVGWFKAPEGLFDLSLWGLDNAPLHKLVQRAVQASPMDTRREMWRSIYLSGGLTMMPGLPERLQAELIQMVPSSVTVQVHASPHRAHAAYIGACALAQMAAFQNSCITADEWNKSGQKALRKWHSF